MQAGVFGRDDVVTALVVVREDSGLSPEAIAKHVADVAEDFKQVTGGVFIVEKLPRNEMGKLVRKDLEVMYNSIQQERM